jgi:hypothetical protein
MANEFEAATKGQWNANISNYSLFEAAHAGSMTASLRVAGSPTR